MENSLLSEEKNITLVTTDLKGSEVSEHWADFEFYEDGTKLFFGFKVAGMNARKLNRYLTGLVKVATYPEIV